MEVNRGEKKTTHVDHLSNTGDQLAVEAARLPSYDWLAVNRDGVLLYYGSNEQYPSDDTQLAWLKTYGRFAIISTPEAFKPRAMPPAAEAAHA